MSYYNDPYSAPEKHGLTVLGTVERYSESYSFDLIAVWWAEDGSIYYAQDSGCSCPSPFEYTTTDDLIKVNGWSELDEALKELAPVYGEGYYGCNPDYVVDCAELVLKVRELTR